MSQVYIMLRNLPVTLVKIPLLFVYILVAILSLPFVLIEDLLFAGKIKKQEIDPSPVFIIGHWRSGTTYLHQLLCNDKQFGYINFYSAMFPNSFLWTEKIMKPILDKLAGKFNWRIPFFNNIKYDFDFPCEEDTALLNAGSPSSAYWAYAFPKKAMNMFARTMYFNGSDAQTEKKFMHDYLLLLKKISLKHKNKRLLLKSPPNTARIKLLLKTFPGAKFIYISRKPAQLYYSHHKLWRQCIKHYALQEIDQPTLDGIIIQTMKNMRLQYNEDRKLLNHSNLYEVSYEEIKTAPLTVIKEMYAQLEIPGFIEAEKNILTQINKSKKYTPFSYTYNDEKIKWVEESVTA